MSDVTPTGPSNPISNVGDHGSSQPGEVNLSKVMGQFAVQFSSGLIDSDGSPDKVAIGAEVGFIVGLSAQVGGAMNEVCQNQFIPDVKALSSDPSEENFDKVKGDLAKMAAVAPTISTSDLTGFLVSSLGKASEEMKDGNYDAAWGIIDAVTVTITSSGVYSDQTMKIATSLNNSALSLAWGDGKTEPGKAQAQIEILIDSLEK